MNISNTASNEQKQDVGTVDKGRAIQLIVFAQGEEEYAIKIDEVKEIVITPNITRMPQTPAYIKGVANIRGNIIAIINLEEKFQLNTSGQSPAMDKTYTLVLESNEYKAGIQVKQMPNTLTVYENDIEEAVNIIQSSSLERNYIKGIVKQDQKLIILIDTAKVVSDQELQAANSAV